MADHETFELGPLTLQRGLTVPKAHLAYKTYGMLAPDKSNVILYPTSYGAHHTDIEWLFGRVRVLDPERYFIVIPNQFGNGLSTSPSNLAEPFGLGRNRHLRTGTMVHAQERLLREKFGVTRLALVYGWSMGGQQASFPDRVARICAVCTSARTSPHNKVFLEGIRATLTADGRMARRTLRRAPGSGPARLRTCVCRLGDEPGVLSRKALGARRVCLARGLSGTRLGGQFPAPPWRRPLVDDRYLVSIRAVEQFDDRVPKRD